MLFLMFCVVCYEVLCCGKDANAPVLVACCSGDVTGGDEKSQDRQILKRCLLKRRYGVVLSNSNSRGCIWNRDIVPRFFCIVEKRSSQSLV